MIFVQIVSYRDKEVTATIADCLAKAKWPDALSFGIVYQYGPGDAREPIPVQAKYLNFETAVERGVGFMRNAANSLYSGEDYYLQVDSHTQFERDWDQILLNQLHTSTHSKPLITTYPGMYWLGEDGSVKLGGNTSSIVMIATGWHPSNLIILEPHVLPNRKQQDGFAVAGGFIFTTGEFAKVVPYDPKILFIGEEIVLAAQAYTRGYDIVHPSACPLYHHYTRESAAKPWKDFASVRPIVDRESEQRVAQILREGNDCVGYFGSVRSFAEYEAHSGVSFSDYTIQPNAVNVTPILRPRRA